MTVPMLAISDIATLQVSQMKCDGPEKKCQYCWYKSAMIFKEWRWIWFDMINYAEQQ